MARVVVVGAGVIGLNTALALEEAGHDVQVIAAAKGANTTSAAAGAIWYPFKVGPPDLVSKWAGATLRWLVDLANKHPEAGVDVLARSELSDNPSPPWWANATPGVRRVDASPTKPLPNGAAYSWVFDAPRCDPLVFLAWLEHRLKNPVRIERIDSLTPLCQSADFVINCCGLGARSLTGDADLQAIYGQTVIVSPGRIDLKQCLGDERDEARMFYSIPRRSEVVVGGCAEPCADDRPTTTTRAMTDAILSRAAGMGLEPGPVLRESAGLRPYRPTVRLEPDAADSRILHNYGHGGAGYTLCRGCAEAIVALIA
ncbi:MAG: FAD-binding oxidoreductase [Phycisphaeraceae bacterium]|nr:FAD-binding oxidoreductase [Phycisphaeraceae bacterium]